MCCDAGKTLCGNACVDLQTSAGNCGACGTTCGGGAQCAAGGCVATCNPGLANCSGVCVNETVDRDNCGGCGIACDSDQKCSSGTCVSACTAGQLSCDGQCVDPLTDAENCGGCDLGCRLANASSICVAGSCAISQCAAGFADCDHNPANGCETNLNSDLNNCGACGHACPAAGQQCVNGACACPVGQTLCNGACVDLQTDVNNCGSCGGKCAFPNASAVCSSGTCTFSSCNAGFGNCDRIASDGCEANFETDVNNCGGCGIRCGGANVESSACSAGACTITACNAGFGNCDRIASDGCEANFETDVNNCGGCGIRCGGANVESSACSAGACTITACNAGFGNCDRIASDGCEANFETDVNNCGGCGIACVTGQSCVAGACQ